VADGSLELGDPLDVEFVDLTGIVRPAVQLIAGYNLPLDAASAMSIDGRDPLAEDLPT
jgi:hypothetical protein